MGGIVELWHAGRRGLFDETAVDVNRKVQPLADGRRPLICIGENARRQGGPEKRAVLRNKKVNVVVAPP